MSARADVLESIGRAVVLLDGVKFASPEDYNKAVDAVAVLFRERPATPAVPVGAPPATLPADDKQMSPRPAQAAARCTAIAIVHGHYRECGAALLASGGCAMGHGSSTATSSPTTPSAAPATCQCDPEDFGMGHARDCPKGVFPAARLERVTSWLRDNPDYWSFRLGDVTVRELVNLAGQATLVSPATPDHATWWKAHLDELELIASAETLSFVSYRAGAAATPPGAPAGVAGLLERAGTLLGAVEAGGWLSETRGIGKRVDAWLAEYRALAAVPVPREGR